MDNKHTRQIKDISYGLAVISYSQQSEDLEVFRRFNGKRNGYYVDIGAFDPVIFSNTNLFYQNNCEGINIEPNPENFERFKKFRTRDINLNLGISDEKNILKIL